MCPNLALTVLYVPESGLDCLICAYRRVRSAAGTSIPFQGATAFERKENSSNLFKNFHLNDKARILLRPSYTCQNPALTICYVPESGLKCLVCASKRVRSAAGTSMPSQAATAFERKDNSLKRVKDFHLKAKARIWP